MDAALRVALPEGEPCQVGLFVTGDETVRELNRGFRGLDEVTDVLSFSASHPGRWEGEAEAPEGRQGDPGEAGAPAFVLPPGQSPPLGEVIVSYPQAQRQAVERGEPAERELALLIVHGVLHLSGHDHEEPEESARMQTREQAALESIFVPGL
jgi:probable rRNA maturation factor|tara:strand:- start:650 stop:1108 length:459 start_codon:yes stop_codon:yes gene_type:complete